MGELYSAMDVSASALTSQRKRLEMLVRNIANAQTTRTAEGGPYRRKDVVFVTRPMRSFGEFLLEVGEDMDVLEGVEIDRVVTDTSPPLMRYEPGHPDANEEGYVAYPNINPLEEMANLLSATRSFEANVKAFEAIKELVRRSIELGKK